MKFIELAKRRFSSRKYQNKPIPKELLTEVLEAGRIAPSAANKQPWIFYVVQKEENRNKISEAYHREWLKDAPVIIVIGVDHNKSWVRVSDNKDHADIDAAIAIDHMTLQAAESDLATCWICNFDPALCRKILNLPAYLEPIAILPLAYPADEADPERHTKQRNALDEIVHWEL